MSRENKAQSETTLIKYAESRSLGNMLKVFFSGTTIIHLQRFSKSFGRSCSLAAASLIITKAGQITTSTLQILSLSELPYQFATAK
jgi:hypothetical protein